MTAKLLALLLPAALALAAAAGPSAPLKNGPGSDVTVLGDSSLGKWRARAGRLEIKARASRGPGALLNRVRGGGLSGLDLVIDVAGIKTDKGASMDSVMYKALELEKFKDIRFSMKRYRVAGDEVLAAGTLTIHGVAREVELTGTLAAAGAGVKVSGSYDTAMTDWGVKPPTMALGAFRVADRITIRYDFDLGE